MFSNAKKRKLVLAAADWLENGRNNWCRGDYMKFKGETIPWREGILKKKEVKSCCSLGAMFLHLPKKMIKELDNETYHFKLTEEIGQDFCRKYFVNIIDFNDGAKNKKEVIKRLREFADTYLPQKKEKVA